MVKNFNKKAKNYEKTICAAISILAFLVIWQLVVSFTKAGMVLAGPIETLSMFVISIVKPLGTHTIEGHILWSLSRVLVGFIIGSVLGIVLGILMGWFKPMSALFRPIFEILRPIPPIAWIPLSIVWFGLGESSKYFLIMYSAFCAVTMNAYSGVRSVDPELIGAAKCLEQIIDRYLRQSFFHPVYHRFLQVYRLQSERPGQPLLQPRWCVLPRVLAG